MLKDIKNEVQSSKLRSKRPINEDCSVGASLMDIENGRMVPINQDSEFIIGRDLTSSIIIEESFISRRHCSIRYENNHYFISDLQSRSGTFLNCKRLSSSKTNIKQLHHGDLIGFGDERNITITYKFILPNISNKKPRLYNEHDLEDHTEDETCKMNIKTIQKEILNIKADHIVLRNNAKTKLDEIQNMMSNIVEITSIENEKQNDAIQKMTNEISTLMVKLKEALNDVNSPNSFKKQIYSQLETELQCTICNELMYKAMVLNCNHTFCEICIETWKSSNPACPICRTHITYYSNCLTLDNYITNICDLIGGEVNDQRQSLQRENFNVLSIFPGRILEVSRICAFQPNNASNGDCLIPE
ncbi:E3 ubiquitin-protein ligase rnf8-A-like [Sipha flava]|uniref:E3 ubiquitin-protein ligase CHFR n=1 Tax=Sipha flava TaxID=143950 RepID=A0A8B8FYM9_9HEMI|nr:E3 ubiquitin-protein ligase rnf8-A-like [Sipha flava]